jgi:SAM-dependent methyltransferase
VTGVDFSETALAHARSRAEAIGADVADRVDWVEDDLVTWTPQAGHYDLVACLYIHVPGSVQEMVRRMATGAAPGGTLLLVGHRPVDPATGNASPAAGQVQVSSTRRSQRSTQPARSSSSFGTQPDLYPAGRNV